MDLLLRFKGFIREHRLLTADQRVIVAVSGGVDSMVLVHLCIAAQLQPVLAHCNFSLRNEMSDGDEALIKEYGALHGLEVVTRRFDTQAYASEKKISIQLAARELRYGWFKTLAEEAGGEKQARLLTAHHLDDNTETMLMNFFRGTGIAGLRGIRPLNGWLARPLLFAKKKELTSYATANHISWRNDHSNEENKYTRNFFRNQLIPLISTVFPEVEQHLAANQERFTDIAVMYDQSLQRHLKKLLLRSNDEVHVPFRKLLLSAAPRTIAWEIFRQYGFNAAAIDEILALCNSETGRYVSSSTHRVIRNRNWLVIAPVVQVAPGLIVIDAPGSCTFAGGEIRITAERREDQPLAVPENEVLLDAGEIRFPLILRPWKSGDYFYPLGMRKKKKVARFLIDRKLSKTEKEKVWVIESQKRIVWLLGHRPDDRFRITGSTTNILRLRFQPTGNLTAI